MHLIYDNKSKRRFKRRFNSVDYYIYIVINVFKLTIDI